MYLSIYIYFSKHKRVRSRLKGRAGADTFYHLYEIQLFNSNTKIERRFTNCDTTFYTFHDILNLNFDFRYFMFKVQYYIQDSTVTGHESLNLRGLKYRILSKMTTISRGSPRSSCVVWHAEKTPRLHFFSFFERPINFTHYIIFFQLLVYRNYW